MVFHIRRGGIQWAPRIRVLHAPVVAVAGRAVPPDPLVGVRACTLGGPGDSVRARRAPLPEGHVTSPDPFPSGRRVWMVGVGRTVTGAVPSCLVPRRMSHSVATSNRDGGAVTGVSGWDPGHIHCGNGGPTPPVPGAVAEWLVFNTFVRRAVGRRGRLSLVPRDGLERGGDESPARG